jgi:hypothetical protein
MKAILFAAAVLAILSAATTTQVQAQTTTTITTHNFHAGNWMWRQGTMHPNGFLHGQNVVTIPSTTLQQSIVNNCPAYAPVLLSTGACITVEQSQVLAAQGQLQVGGQVTADGSVIVGTPTVVGAQGYQNPFAFAGHAWHFHK